MKVRNVKLFLVLDFEANCSSNGSHDHEICEFPAVLLNEKGCIVSEFRTFVKPVRIAKMSKFATDLTGITDSDIESGLTWSEAISAFDKWCEKEGIHSLNCVVVTCGDWDLKTMYIRQLSITKTKKLIPKRVQLLFDHWTNLKIAYSDFKKYDYLLGMDNMLFDANITLVGRHHSGIDDCKNIASLCKYLIDNGQFTALSEGNRSRTFLQKLFN